MIISFTGHRPSKIGGYNLPNPTYIHVCRQLENLLKDINPDKAISGLALGIDQYAANICIKLGIPFIAAIPFEGQEKAWPAQSQKVYHQLLKLAAEKVIVSPGGYSAAKMQIRNKWMVNNSDKLIGVWDGSSGGTANCINYAKAIGREIIIINPQII